MNRTFKTSFIFIGFALLLLFMYVVGYNDGKDFGSNKTEEIYTKLLQEQQAQREAQPVRLLVVYQSWHTGMQYVLCTTDSTTEFMPIKSLTGDIITREVCSEVECTIKNSK